MDLEGASVLFSMIDSNGSYAVQDAVGSIGVDVEGIASIVQYAWDSGDTDVEGIYRGEFLIDSDVGLFRIPVEGYFPIIIGPSITSTI